MAKQTTTQKLLTYISKFDGVTSIGLAAQDLQLSVETVRKHFARLCNESRCCFGWDGQALSLTDSEALAQQQRRPMDDLRARLQPTR